MKKQKINSIEIIGNSYINKQHFDEILDVFEVFCKEYKIPISNNILTIHHVSSEKIRNINKEYRNVDKVTDVLSFPMYDDINDLLDDSHLHMGDIIICEDKIKEQAIEYNHSIELEYIYLLIHSLLHLIGYDHIKADEKVLMRNEEKRLLNILKKRKNKLMDNLEINNYINKVTKAMNNAYVPYSNFRVGALLIDQNKCVYTGCNIENASYGATICAERTAIFKAISEGKKEFDAIFIKSDSENLTFPCGICRQVLVEFMPEGDVYVINKYDEYKVFKVKSLLPNYFSSKDMESKDV